MRTLVLVDNNKDNFQFIIDALASTDPHVQCLSLVFPDEAIKGLRSQLIGRPDAIFVNFSMPGKNGVEFILQLRSDSELKHVPVILYADKVTINIHRSLENAGCTMIIEKPRTLREWKIKIQEILHSIDGSEVNISSMLTLPQEEAMLTTNNN